MNAAFREGHFQHLMFAEVKARFGAAVIDTYVTERREERNLGWDVLYRIRSGPVVRPIFIQYKVPQLVTRRYRDRACLDFFGEPHLRFHLHQDEKSRKT